MTFTGNTEERLRASVAIAPLSKRSIR